MMLQSYFMFFYVAFCFSMWTSDQNSEEETFGHVLWERISLGAGLIVLTIFVRPVLLNLIYFVFYEPLSKVEEGDIKTLKRLRLAVKKRKIETKTFTKTATQDLTRNAEESGKFENERVSKDTTAVVGATALNFKKATPDRLA